MRVSSSVRPICTSARESHSVPLGQCLPVPVIVLLLLFTPRYEGSRHAWLSTVIIHHCHFGRSRLLIKLRRHRTVSWFRFFHPDKQMHRGIGRGCYPVECCFKKLERTSQVPISQSQAGDKHHIFRCIKLGHENFCLGSADAMRHPEPLFRCSHVVKEKGKIESNSQIGFVR